MAKKNTSFDIEFPPFDFSIQVFTDKISYAKHCRENKLWEEPDRDEKDLMQSHGFTSFPPKQYEFQIAIYLPKQGVLSDMELEETIDHELIHVILLTYRHFGSGVGLKPEQHETFCWHHNYLDRKIKTIVYGKK